MNQLFVVVSVLLLASVSVAKTSVAVWPKEVVTKLQSKNPYKAFCDSSVGVQTSKSCQAFSKLKESKQKWPTVSVKNGVLILNDGKRTMEMKRTSEVTRFEINRQSINMADHRDGQSLYKAIAELTPKVAARSLWMNSAYAEWYAEDATTYDLMSVAAHQVVSATSDLETCKAAQEFVKQCAKNIDGHSEITLFNYFLEKVSKDKAFSEDEKRMFLSSIDNLSYELIRMRNLTKGFDKKTDALIGCPSVKPAAGRSAANDVIECAQELEEGIRDMKILPDLIVEKPGASEQMEEIESEVASYSKKASNKTPAKTSKPAKKAEGKR